MRDTSDNVQPRELAARHGRFLPADAELLQRAAEGDRNAFEMIYLRYRRDVWNCLARSYRSLDDQTIEDLVHEVFLRIWQKREHMSGVRSPSGYFRRMANNALADRYRGQKADWYPLSSDMQAPDLPPYQKVQREELRQQVARALVALTESHRLALELNEADLTAKQAASVSGTSGNAARRRLQRAREALVLGLSRCGSSCAMDNHCPALCPAAERNLHCLKWVYKQGVSARREKL